MTTTTKRPTPKQEKILRTKQEHPDLSTREIATLCNTGHTHVLATFKRYGIEQEHVEAFKKHRGDVFAGLQHRLLASVTDQDIKKTPVGSRVLAAAQLFDKERLERGQATSIQDYRGLSVELSGSIADAQRLLDELEGRGQQGQSGGIGQPVIDVTPDPAGQNVPPPLSD